ncbi:methyltransferase domain-containing protein [Zobellia amurskyensis]|uniref:Methyltransferase domain-containing protein n=1 Tax=Zobellia amurskyensis TaxID=248905 RepID=A0A7X3D2G3_9FLAO|nr:methyltransferase domain-containing protein [Zobellia amurskyensis]MUH37219.1 methyltransferase domain-containing protein [Zobellia amurskyensis]
MGTKKHNKNIVEQFSKQATGYTSITSHGDSLEKLISITSASKNDETLDIACGSGIVSCEFAKHTNHVTGIDMTQGMLDEAKKLQTKINLKNLTWQIGDVESLPYGDNSFSIVVSRFGFHHFLNPLKVLSEMKRVCKPNGIVMVVDVSLPDSKIKKYNKMEKNRDCSHVAALSLTEFSSLFEKAGFKEINSDFYSMKIELYEQLKASFPSDPIALEKMIIADIGINDLGVSVTEVKGEFFLYYPIQIFSARK